MNRYTVSYIMALVAGPLSSICVKCGGVLQISNVPLRVNTKCFAVFKYHCTACNLDRIENVDINLIPPGQIRAECPDGCGETKCTDIRCFDVEMLHNRIYGFRIGSKAMHVKCMACGGDITLPLKIAV